MTKKETITEDVKESIDEFKKLVENIDSISPVLEKRSDKRERVNTFLNFHNQRLMGKYTKYLLWANILLVSIGGLQVMEAVYGPESVRYLLETQISELVKSILTLMILYVFLSMIYDAIKWSFGRFEFLRGTIPFLKKIENMIMEKNKSL